MSRETGRVLSRATPLLGAEAGPLGKRHRRPLGFSDAGGTRDVEGRGDVLAAEAGRVQEHVTLGAHLLELATRHRWNICQRDEGEKSSHVRCDGGERGKYIFLLYSSPYPLLEGHNRAPLPPPRHCQKTTLQSPSQKREAQ